MAGPGSAGFCFPGDGLSGGGAAGRRGPRSLSRQRGEWDLGRSRGTFRPSRVRSRRARPGVPEAPAPRRPGPFPSGASSVSSALVSSIFSVTSLTSWARFLFKSYLALFYLLFFNVCFFSGAFCFSLFSVSDSICFFLLRRRLAPPGLRFPSWAPAVVRPVDPGAAAGGLGGKRELSGRCRGESRGSGGRATRDFGLAQGQTCSPHRSLRGRRPRPRVTRTHSQPHSQGKRTHSSQGQTPHAQMSHTTLTE